MSNNVSGPQGAASNKASEGVGSVSGSQGSPENTAQAAAIAAMYDAAATAASEVTPNEVEQNSVESSKKQEEMPNAPISRDQGDSGEKGKNSHQPETVTIEESETFALFPPPSNLTDSESSSWHGQIGQSGASYYSQFLADMLEAFSEATNQTLQQAVNAGNLQLESAEAQASQTRKAGETEAESLRLQSYGSFAQAGTGAIPLAGEYQGSRAAAQAQKDANRAKIENRQMDYTEVALRKSQGTNIVGSDATAAVAPTGLPTTTPTPVSPTADGSTRAPSESTISSTEPPPDSTIPITDHQKYGTLGESRQADIAEIKKFGHLKGNGENGEALQNAEGIEINKDGTPLPEDQTLGRRTEEAIKAMTPDDRYSLKTTIDNRRAENRGIIESGNNRAFHTQRWTMISSAIAQSANQVIDGTIKTMMAPLSVEKAAAEAAAAQYGASLQVTSSLVQQYMSQLQSLFQAMSSAISTVSSLNQSNAA